MPFMWFKKNSVLQFIQLILLRQFLLICTICYLYAHVRCVHAHYHLYLVIHNIYLITWILKADLFSYYVFCFQNFICVYLVPMLYCCRYSYFYVILMLCDIYILKNYYYFSIFYLYNNIHINVSYGIQFHSH